ncbi:hypothetical protein ACFL5P_02130 [candidate division KSB1 bacterium]
MLRKTFLIIFASLLLSTQAFAQRDGFGLGIVLGEPTGISGKFWQTQSTAINGAIAWAFGKEDAFHIHADYVFHDFDRFEVDRGSMPFYFGIGGRIASNDVDDYIGARFPIGIEYILEDNPLHVFFEIVPIFDIIPATDFDMNVGIGIRYFFGKTRVMR